MLRVGTHVTHADYGPGRVTERLGDVVLVEFFGEQIQVDASELQIDGPADIAVSTGVASERRIPFRRAFEALNLGVVPPDPTELIELSIGGEAVSSEVSRWLGAAHHQGLCKAVFGDYGSGKSHYLRLAQGAALASGWVVSFVEFDPKQADPAKPHLVYRSVVSGMKFPQRVDGSRSETFYDFIREVRIRWDDVSVDPYLKSCPWFLKALTALRCLSALDREYYELCDWLAGQPIAHAAVAKTCRHAAPGAQPPPILPRNRETAEIYALNLTVLHHLCRRVGYKGLLIIFDEAEHVRGFNVRRRERANNLFHFLARCSHLPLPGEPAPYLNEWEHTLPPFWDKGPHFGVVVGLTEGDTFSDPSLSLREACVFLHDAADLVRLHPPSPESFREWCSCFLGKFHSHYPVQTRALSEFSARDQIASTLSQLFMSQPQSERTIRLWVKLASLVPSLTLVDQHASIQTIEQRLVTAARSATGLSLSWEM